MPNARCHCGARAVLYFISEDATCVPRGRALCNRHGKAQLRLGRASRYTRVQYSCNQYYVNSAKMFSYHNSITSMHIPAPLWPSHLPSPRLIYIFFFAQFLKVPASEYEQKSRHKRSCEFATDVAHTCDDGHVFDHNDEVTTHRSKLSLYLARTSRRFHSRIINVGCVSLQCAGPATPSNSGSISTHPYFSGPFSSRSLSTNTYALLGRGCYSLPELSYPESYS